MDKIYSKYERENNRFIQLKILFIIISIVFIIYLLYKRALTSLIIGGFISYFLNPFIEKISNKGLKRFWIVMVCYILLILVVITLIIFFIPKLVGQLNEFSEFISQQMPLIDTVNLRYNEFLENIDPNFKKILEDIVRQSSDKGSEYLRNSISTIVNGIIGMVSQITNLIIGFVIAFYLNNDFYDIKQIVVSWIPKNIRENVLLILSDIDKVLGSFIRGQLTVAFIVGTLSIIGLKIIGIKSAFSIGIIMGIFNIIPYFGPILGLIPAILMAAPGGIKMIILTSIVLLIIQQLESGLITPKIVGNSLGLHPLFVILSILIGGKLFDFAGMILAVPTAGILKALGDRFLLE